VRLGERRGRTQLTDGPMGRVGAARIEGDAAVEIADVGLVPADPGRRAIDPALDHLQGAWSVHLQVGVADDDAGGFGLGKRRACEKHDCGDSWEDDRLGNAGHRLAFRGWAAGLVAGEQRAAVSPARLGFRQAAPLTGRRPIADHSRPFAGAAFGRRLT